MSEPPALDETALESLMAEVADEFVHRQKLGEQPRIEEYAQRHPALATVIRQVLSSLQLIRLSGSDDEAPTEALDLGAAVTHCLGDYRLLREVGRGGMGVVYEAEQISLGRRVALKVLPFAAALDGKQLQRFKHEAQAAAHLHHTNIVPVFAVGYERGVHYYAMQFIDGQTVADVIAQLRQLGGLAVTEPGGRPGWLSQAPVVRQPACADGSTEVSPQGALSTQRPALNPGYFRTAARLGVQAAEALEHAHEQGIVHRDVKPANLLVDAKGHLWVTDFGLAQFQGDARLTQTGDLLGTLRYMSPEQALARHRLVDHRTDIYSLGVTLYELLTLEPAFRGTDRQEILRQIAFEEPRPVRRLNKAVPADLETVVRKAMAKEPEERYATAQELADDLRRFLDDKPVRARKPTLWQLAAKWSRRHKGLVRSAVAALVLLVVGLGSCLLLIWGEKRRTEEALAHSRENQAQAEKAVNDFYTEVAEQWLENEPRSQTVQRQFLEKALAHYQGFLRQNNADPRLRQETGRAYLRVGNIQQKLGQGEQAAEAYDQAIRIFAKLAREFPRVDQHRRDLASCHNSRAILLMHAGQPTRAEEAYRWARDLLEQVVADAPDDAAAQDQLAAYHTNLAILLMDAGRYRDAEEGLKQAFKLRVRGLVRLPDSPTHRYGLAVTLSGQGLLYWQTGRLAQARQAWVQALELDRKLVRDNPGQRRYRDSLTKSYDHLAALCTATGQMQEARRLWEHARTLHQKLADDFPNVVDYQIELASTHYNLAGVLREAGEIPEAEQAYRQALDLLERLAQKAQPQHAARFRRQQATGFNNLGNLLKDVGRLEEAEQRYRQALALLETEPDTYGKAPAYRDDLTIYLNNLGYLCYLTGRHEEAEALYRRAVPIREGLVQDFPAATAYREKLAGTYANLANLLRDRGRPGEAEEACRKALAHEERMTADFPRVGRHWQSLAGGWHKLGQLLLDQGRPGEARRAFRHEEDAWRQGLGLNADDAAAHYHLAFFLATCPDVEVRGPAAAVQLARRAVALAERLAMPPESRGEVWATLGISRYRAGDPAGAAQALEKARRLNPSGGGSGLFCLAMAHWHLGHRDEARRYFGEAVAALEKQRARDDGLRRWQAEAALLLGVQAQVTPPAREVTDAWLPAEDFQETPFHRCLLKPRRSW
jgi:serine/threonine protein kinase/Flp pilus assembly protein TadD